MEKRRSVRKALRLKAERISGNSHHAVFIEDISEQGIRILTAPGGLKYEFFPDTPLNLKFELSTGEAIDLRCRVRWSYRNEPPNDLTSSVGMEIIDPPQRYREFVKNIP